MAVHYPALAERVRNQARLQPTMYGEVDFTKSPFRFTTDPDVRSALNPHVSQRAPALSDERAVELMQTATMLGDVVADPYAALVDQYGVKGLIQMLTTACRKGVDAVPDAPKELRAFLASMEATPDWLDMELVEEGARQSRVAAAFQAPFVVRGAFLATFNNTYAALPMALTGALSGNRAARRVIETSSFFAVTTLPGALSRHGVGFETTAHVRLMHSVVRYNALKRSAKWDLDVYGIPVPQVDQMPAGMINSLLMAVRAVRDGRSEWSPRERAIHEFVRYRCFLLGLPEELLPNDPHGIIRAFQARSATLRYSFDDETCGRLVRSTLAAYLRPGTGFADRIAERIETAWSRIFFSRTVGRGKGVSASMGVVVTPGDRLLMLATAPLILGRFALVNRAVQLGPVQKLADAYTLRTLKKRLATYGVDQAMTEAHGHMTD